MGKFDGVLVCTDLDGTLFRSDKTVSRENREAIEYFKHEGGAFTFMTGRLPFYAESAYRAAAPNVPYGCANGGALYDGEAGRYVWRCELDRRALALVACVAEAFPEVGIQMSAFERAYFSRENEVMYHFRRVTGLENLVCPYREVEEPLSKVLFGIKTEEELLAVERTLRSHPLAEEFDFIRSETHLFEILPKGVHKGLALQKLAEHLGIDPKMTVAIGDYDNDIGMFRTAHVGVAVANACPAARAAADYVTVSNEESAIARVIAELPRLLGL
ncbi:MAG: HAD family phosphatase [Clostridia bacterium]|nr:HAD family phosphatase [Clostridia bacterium]